MPVLAILEGATSNEDSTGKREPVGTTADVSQRGKPG